MKKRIAGILALVVFIGSFAHAADPLPVKVIKPSPTNIYGKPCGYSGC
jgi:hypothetical protein